VGLKRTPKTTWFCPPCSTLRAQRPQAIDRGNDPLFRFNFDVDLSPGGPITEATRRKRGRDLPEPAALATEGATSETWFPPKWLPRQPAISRSVIWSKTEKFSKTTDTRRSNLNFIKKQIKGYVAVFLGGRSTKTVALKEGGDHFPTKKCPACKCLHAGGIRCYLSSDEDDLFLSVFVRPFGKTLKAALLAKKAAKEGEALGFDHAEGEEAGEEEEK